MPRKSTPDDFWKQIDQTDIDGCWEWQGAKDDHGYGRVRYHQKEWKAHRLAWTLTNSDPERELLCHKCDNPSCCNPAHLFLGTQIDNMQDSTVKGRHPRNKTNYLPSGSAHHAVKTPELMARGEKNGSAVLTAAKVRKIRKLSAEGMTRQAVATKFGVAKGTIIFILNGHTWRHVK